VDHREGFLHRETKPAKKFVYSYPSTRFWVYSAWCSITILASIWITTLVNYLASPK